MIERPTPDQVTGFPAQTIDPRDVPDRELPTIGLPPRPRDARLRRGWDRLFARKLEIKHFERKVHVVIDRATPQPPEQPRATRFENSRNWSGATIAAHGDRSLVFVLGLWRMPTVDAVPVIPGKPGGLSMWVGLDGTRRDFDSSLPQIGTTATVNPGSVDYSAWTQWWARDTNNTGPVPLAVPVAAGDLMGGAVFVRDPFTVGMVLINLDAVLPVCMPVTVTSPPVLRPTGMQQPRISGGSADWVLERPALLPDIAHPFDRELAPFPAYSPTKFEFCAAGQAPRLDLAGVFEAEWRDLLAARRDPDVRSAAHAGPNRVHLDADGDGTGRDRIAIRRVLKRPKTGLRRTADL